MGNEIKLTIGIPTYNGEKYIKQTIESIFKGISDKNFNRIEILVSDNCSTDKTATIIQELNEKYNSKITYFYNEENIGYDRNVDNVVKRAKGEYVWLMSDDDYIVNNGIEKVIFTLDKNEFEFIFVNYQNPILIKEIDSEPMDGDRFFSITKFKSGLISSNIVKKQRWIELNMEKYFDCLWIHFAYTIEALAPIRLGKAAIINDFVVIPDGESRWGAKGSFIFTGFKLLDVFKIIPALGYNKKTKKVADFVIKGGYPKNLILAKYQGLKINLDIIKKFIYYYKQYPSFWVFDLPILLVPSIFIKISVNSYRLVIKLMKTLRGN